MKPDKQQFLTKTIYETTITYHYKTLHQRFFNIQKTHGINENYEDALVKEHRSDTGRSVSYQH